MTTATLDAKRPSHRKPDPADTPVDSLIASNYEELCRVAAVLIQRESHGNTLTAPALVHEAYLRVARKPQILERGRRYFFGAVVRAMRCVLVDCARRRSSLKRGSGVGPVTLDESLIAVERADTPAVDMERALSALLQVAQRPARVVRCRFLRGLSVDETAAELGVTARTVKRDWRFARGWLQDYLAASA